MTVSNEQLMAYLDGEWVPPDREALHAQIAADPDLARRFAAQVALREQLQRGFQSVLDERVPARLLEAVRSGPIHARPSPARKWTPWSGPVWLSAAASLVVGIVIGPRLQEIATGTPLFLERSGKVIAAGSLDRLLSRQLAAEQSTSDPLRVGVSFVASTGEYCRTFIDAKAGVEGIACREPEAWRVQILTSSAVRPASRAAYTQAGTSLSPLVLQAAGSLMSGEALDAAGEAAARAAGWRQTATTGAGPRQP